MSDAPKTHMICKSCGRSFLGKTWRKHSARDCTCRLCRGKSGDDWGLSHDPYASGLDLTTRCSGESRDMINGLMCGMM